MRSSGHGQTAPVCPSPHLPLSPPTIEQNAHLDSLDAEADGSSGQCLTRKDLREFIKERLSEDPMSRANHVKELAI